MTRKYDTVDLESSKKVAKEFGLEVVATKDIGDQQEIMLSGDEKDHNRFREHEGYSEGESQLVEA